MGSRRLTPFELSLDDATVDLTAVATTTYTSPVLDVREAFVYTVVIDVTETGAPTVGDFTLTVRCTDSAGATTYEIDAVTLIDSQTDGSQTIFTWGSGNAATLSGSGTIGTNLDVLKVFDFMEIELEVTTANDGTTSTAAVTLLLEEV